MIEKLPINFEKQGIAFTRLKRVNRVCLYRREGKSSALPTYEVVKLRVLKAGLVNGVEYPEREAYPNNEQFGVLGWCFDSLALAEAKFEALPKV